MGPLQSVAPILKKSALPGGKEGCIADADCALAGSYGKKTIRSISSLIIGDYLLLGP